MNIWLEIAGHSTVTVVLFWHLWITIWLPVRRTSVKPLAASILQTSRPERTRSLPNRDLQTRHEDFIVHALLYLAGIGGFKEKLQRFLQIAPCLFNAAALARDVELRAQRDVTAVFLFNDGS